MSAILKHRMTATQQASELQASDEAYQQIFRRAVPLAPSEICDLPLDTVTGILLDSNAPGMDFSLKAFCQNVYRTSELVGDEIVRELVRKRV